MTYAILREPQTQTQLKSFFFSFFWDSNDSKNPNKRRLRLLWVMGQLSCGCCCWRRCCIHPAFISFCFIFPEIKTVSIPLFLLSKLNHTLSESSFMLCPTPKASDSSLSESNAALGLGYFWLPLILIAHWALPSESTENSKGIVTV